MVQPFVVEQPVQRHDRARLRIRGPVHQSFNAAVYQRAEGSWRLSGTTLYVTLEPCAMCAGALSFGRIRRLYYAAPDPKGGAVDHGPRFFQSPTCHHAPEVYGGIRESEAANMLRAFFEARRG